MKQAQNPSLVQAGLTYSCAPVGVCAACTERQRHPLDQSARRGLSISTPGYRPPRQEQRSWVTRPDVMAALQVTSRQPIPEVTTKLRCWNHTVCVETTEKRAWSKGNEMGQLSTLGIGCRGGWKDLAA